MVTYLYVVAIGAALGLVTAVVLVVVNEFRVAREAKELRQEMWGSYALPDTRRLDSLAAHRESQLEARRVK